MKGPPTLSKDTPYICSVNPILSHEFRYRAQAFVISCQYHQSFYFYMCIPSTQKQQKHSFFYLREAKQTTLTLTLIIAAATTHTISLP
jgi:hypothetical protein